MNQSKPGENLDVNKIRNEKGQFVKGHIQINHNHPGGRPRRIVLQDKIDEVMSDDDLVQIIKANIFKAKRGDKDATKIILEHRFGKPKESVELTGKDRGPIEINDAREHIAGRLAEYAAKQSAQGDTSGTD